MQHTRLKPILHSLCDAVKQTKIGGGGWRVKDKPLKDQPLKDKVPDDITVLKKVTKVHTDRENARIASPPLPGKAAIYQPMKNKRTEEEIMFARFKEYMQDDLVGFLHVHGGRKQHMFRVVTAGGYGIKTLVETKYGLYGKVKTGDVDLTVSTYKCAMNPLECFQYWSKKIHAFFAAQEHPSDFKVQVVNFNHAYVPVMDFHREYVIMVSYKDDDFVDIAITDQKITFDMLDKRTSLKAGLPVKKEEYYLKEVLSLIYMENVPGVNEYSYKKRNPVTGMMRSKGIKDIQRGKLLCSVKKNDLYKEYCALLQDLTLTKLRRMSAAKRDMYFVELRDILHAPQ